MNNPHNPLDEDIYRDNGVNVDKTTLNTIATWMRIAAVVGFLNGVYGLGTSFLSFSTMSDRPIFYYYAVQGVLSAGAALLMAVFLFLTAESFSKYIRFDSVRAFDEGLEKLKFFSIALTAWFGLIVLFRIFNTFASRWFSF